ncbi:hypothetical protein NF552_26220 (plasmid) [Roseomonas mucosa]|nr:hypothetical protein NF552_26220 [Roseomonas mucosa]
MQEQTQIGGVSEAVRRAGGLRPLARAVVQACPDINVTQRMVQRWLAQGWVKAEHVAAVVKATGVPAIDLIPAGFRTAILEDEAKRAKGRPSSPERPPCP